MPAWPETLPLSPLAGSFRETLPDTVLRTGMDQGPAKLRQRSTAGTRGILVSYILDRAQVMTLDDFHETALEGGALSFSYTHPRDDNTVTCRFKRPPEFVSLNGDYYRVTLELEILP